MRRECRSEPKPLTGHSDPRVGQRWLMKTSHNGAKLPSRTPPKYPKRQVTRPPRAPGAAQAKSPGKESGTENVQMYGKLPPMKRVKNGMPRHSVDIHMDK